MFRRSAVALTVLVGMMVWYQWVPPATVVYVPLLLLLMVGTVAGILRRVGMTADEFRELLR